MSTNTKLAIVTGYYIQKLIRKNTQKLKTVCAFGAGLSAKEETDLNQVLESLYLEAEEIDHYIKKLEVLVRWHKTLVQEAKANCKELVQVEAQIYWIVGLKKSASLMDSPETSQQQESPLFCPLLS